MFNSLHTHSHYSLRDGFQSVKDILKFCKENGQTSVALTDHGTMSGCGEGFRYCKEYGINFIAGCEHYLTADVTIKDKKYQHIILYAMNKTGYRNLNIITTEAHKRFYMKPRVDLELLSQYNEGIICTTACLAGCQDKIASLKAIFGDRLYIEIHTNTLIEQREANLQWLRLADKYDVPFYAACDSHYTTTDSADAHRAWSFGGEAYLVEDFYMHTEEQVREALKYLPQDVVDISIANTVVAAERCSYQVPFGENHYPKSGVEDSKLEVRRRVWQGLKDKGLDKNEEHIKQIRHEVEVFEKVDYFDYFIIVGNLIGWCHDNGIRTGVGRGSVVGCDIAFAMDITKVDPLKHGLVFERFAHTERVSPADVDIDVPKKDRQTVIQHLRDKYGEVYQVITFLRMANKSALKRAGQTRNFDHNMIDDLCSKINDLDDLPEQCPWPDIMQEEYEILVSTAYHYKDKLQAFGTHASAVVILDTDPYDYCAVERVKETYNLNYDYKDLEAMGLLKLDILGLETLDVLDECLKNIGEDIDLNRLPEADECYKLLCKGNTKGIFQLESNLMGGLIKRIRPQSIEDLTHIVALGRPAPLQAGIVDEFIDGKKGK